MASSVLARYRHPSKSSLRRFPCPVCSLALNVNDIDEAVAFYSKLFGTEPAKTRSGYANFAIAEPPLKLVLLENPGQGGTLNHLGIEVPDTDAVNAVQARLTGTGVASVDERDTTCCYAGRTSSGSRGCRTARPGRSTQSWATARPSTTQTLMARNVAAPAATPASPQTRPPPRLSAARDSNTGPVRGLFTLLEATAVSDYSGTGGVRLAERRVQLTADSRQRDRPTIGAALAVSVGGYPAVFIILAGA